MDLEKLAQATADSFNDRSYRDNAKDVMDSNVLIVDKPTNQEMRGPEAYVQYSDGFVNAIPDLKGTVIENKIEQEFDDAGKVVRFVIDYDMQDFMRQLGM